MAGENQHKPVLLQETLGCWHGKKGGFYVDATVGAGGHSEALLQSDPDARCLALDRDPDAVQISQERLKPYGKRVIFANESYMNLPEVMKAMDLPRADGVLADLGVSSMQLDRAERGFSFRNAGPLDMRMDPRRGETALDLIGRLSARELEQTIRRYGEEKLARPIALALKRASDRGELTDSARCADVIAAVARPRGGRHLAPGKRAIHPATRTFQALRIAVNGELAALASLLEREPELLARGGRAVFISFHSLEDRLVKDAMRGWSKGCVCPPDFPKCICGKDPEFKILTKKPVEPSQAEAAANPRSRSAKLRAAEKI